MEEHDAHDPPRDPLLERVMKEVRFRPDDPPEVRRALVDEALEREKSFNRSALEPKLHRSGF